MQTIVNGQQYRVSWNHDLESDETTCIIRNEDVAVPDLSATIARHYTEAHHTEKAMKYSLTKVLNQSFPEKAGKPTRKQFWGAFRYQIEKQKENAAEKRTSGRRNRTHYPV